MRFLAVFATLFAGALAQSTNIGAPSDGSTIPTGNITVTVNRPVCTKIDRAALKQIADLP
jgi:hypothetical protein